MPILAQTQSIDHTSSTQTTAEIRIDCIDNVATSVAPEELLNQIASGQRTWEFDYVSYFRCETLGAEAKEINTQSVRFLRRNLNDLLRIGKKAKAFKKSIIARSGEKDGELTLRCWLSIEGEPGHITKAALALYEWYSQLTPYWQRFLKIFASDWSFSCLQILKEVNYQILDLFVWGAQQVKTYRKHLKITATAESLKAIVKACKGLQNVKKSRDLEIADWVSIFAIAQVEKQHFNEILKGAQAIAASHNTEEVCLEDALAALKQFGYDPKSLEKAPKAQQPVKEKVFTSTEVEQIKASYEAQLQSVKETVESKNRELATERAQRQEAEQRAIAAQEQIQQLKRQLEELSKKSETVDVTIDVTPVVETTTTESGSHKKASATSPKFNLRDNVCVIDKNQYKEYYGCTGTVVGKSENGFLWVQLPQHGYRKQFPADALELLAPHESSQEAAAFVPIDERVVQKF